MLMMTLECHGLNGGKASHWLRESWQRGVAISSQLICYDERMIPVWSLTAPLNTFCPSWRECGACLTGVVDRKAGSLADA